MRRYGLIGYPIAHSKSKSFFDELFIANGLHSDSYENFPLESEKQVRDFILNEKGLCGLNITSPYKRLAHALCDELSEEAIATGSVNCIHFNSGKLMGYNTDVFGFVKSIEPIIARNTVETALILGTGGAASAALLGLTKLGVQVKMIGRSGNAEFPRGYDSLDADSLALFDVIVHCTPLGTWPGTEDKLPLPYEGLHADQFIFDMVYNPETTALMRAGIVAGCKVMNGSEMLRLQAIEAWRIWRE